MRRDGEMVVSSIRTVPLQLDRVCKMIKANEDKNGISKMAKLNEVKFLPNIVVYNHSQQGSGTFRQHLIEYHFIHTSYALLIIKETLNVRRCLKFEPSLWTIPATIDRVSFYRPALFSMLPPLPLLLPSLRRLLLGRLHVAQHGQVSVTLLHCLEIQESGSIVTVP